MIMKDQQKTKAISKETMSIRTKKNGNERERNLVLGKIKGI